jgi:polysaccharide export outer membrane protein
MIRSRHLTVLSLSLALAVAGAGCASVGEYVWVDAVPTRYLPAKGEYLITTNDLLNIRVYGQENISGKVRVRSDGKITLPLISEQVAAGLTPTMLGELLETAYKTFVINPVVTVAIEETHPWQVSVLGEVVKPGLYKLELGSDVLTVLAQAGGLTPFASRDGIYVVRRVASFAGEAAERTLRVRFRYEALSRGEGRAALFLMQDGDVLVVE